MSDLNKYTFPEKGTAREAIQLINKIAITNMAIFIVDSEQRLVGSLTDGDIRRGLLNGLTINDPVTGFMNKNSKAFIHTQDNFEKINTYREAGIRFVPIVDAGLKIVDILDLNKLRSIIPVDVILMAGGKGERLKPLTDSIPKPMLEIGNKPIIIHNIERFVKYGITNFHISVGHMASHIINGIKASKIENVNFNFIEESKPLGTVGSVKLVTNTKNENILLMNADLLTNIDFNDFYECFRESKADFLVATIPYQVDIPYAVMDINDNDEVLSFKEKPRYTYYSNAGIYLFKKQLIDLIPENTSFDATHFMEAVIAKKKKLISYPILSYWLDIGRIDDFYKAQEDIKHIDF
ncbi:MAG TPA: sugar phosphate nucleotidyltransferase [Bacteroidia bacterium]|nr:sugar phosphate nucleotidyltransferase [Bacteroidia bacterium]